LFRQAGTTEGAGWAAPRFTSDSSAAARRKRSAAPIPSGNVQSFVGFDG